MKQIAPLLLLRCVLRSISKRILHLSKKVVKRVACLVPHLSAVSYQPKKARDARVCGSPSSHTPTLHGLKYWLSDYNHEQQREKRTSRRLFISTTAAVKATYFQKAQESLRPHHAVEFFSQSFRVVLHNMPSRRSPRLLCVFFAQSLCGRRGDSISRSIYGNLSAAVASGSTGRWTVKNWNRVFVDSYWGENCIFIYSFLWNGILDWYKSGSLDISNH